MFANVSFVVHARVNTREKTKLLLLENSSIIWEVFYSFKVIKKNNKPVTLFHKMGGE